MKKLLARFIGYLIPIVQEELKKSKPKSKRTTKKKPKYVQPTLDEMEKSYDYQLGN